jgi:hypothetical protein
MGLLLIARSLRSSSAFGELIHSTRSASGNSVPMTGVMSMDLNWSSDLEDLRGSLPNTVFCFILIS